ncbi:hypothetical protein EK904_011012 [Melospiza melodia maxima]|nr:hypothetical protein EK904_011012 [Melospiza melodia maxima]
MLKYYLDLLQCPICKKGTWSLIEILVRSCLYCETVCHTVTVSGTEDELRIVHKTLLKFFFDLVKGEVEFLTKRSIRQIIDCSMYPLSLACLLPKIVQFQPFRSEVAGLLNAILGTVVDYWIISGLLMDRNVFHQVPDLAHYLAISCDGEFARPLKILLIRC